MVSHPHDLGRLVAVAIGGLAFVFTSGDSQAEKRQAALQKGGVKAKDNAVEKIARKKQIADSLKDLEKRRAADAPQPRHEDSAGRPFDQPPAIS